VRVKYPTRMKEDTRGKGEEGKREKGRIESDRVRAFVWNWDSGTDQETKKKHT